MAILCYCCWGCCCLLECVNVSPGRCSRAQRCFGFAAFLRWAEVASWPWTAKARGWIKNRGGKKKTRQTRLFSFPLYLHRAKNITRAQQHRHIRVFSVNTGKSRGGQGSQSSLLFITVDHSLKHEGEWMLWSTCGGFIPLFISCYQRKRKQEPFEKHRSNITWEEGFVFYYS